MSRQVYIIIDYVYGMNCCQDVQPKILRVYSTKTEAEEYVERRYKSGIDRGLEKHQTRILEIKEFQLR